MGTPRQRSGEELTAPRWRRYVAIGDSSTEGLDDPDGSGGFRGWADRLAGFIAVHQGGLEYANLAIRGRNTAQIQAEQVPLALGMRPDLVSVVAGMNDILTPGFDAIATAAAVETMFRTFTDAGVAVLSLTLPDPTPNLPLTRIIGPRLAAFNEAVHAAAVRSGVIMVDVASYTDASDPRLWSDDRLHGNSEGHERVARALAHGLGLPGFDESWRDPLPPAPEGVARIAGVRADLQWAQLHALPWLWRTVRGRSAGDGLAPKRPEPFPLPAETNRNKG
jgi:lysophospholipase L1-like esterase